tara:strand:+ start:256 stop:468 length:213 start_codon:yes stop_codon:yes gene_type:complete
MCGSPLLKDELPENRHPVALPLHPAPREYECRACYFQRADLDGKSDDPELQKGHVDFIKNEKIYRKSRLN